MSTSMGASVLSDLSPDDYRISDVERIMTPALLIYPDMVAANIGVTLRLLGGDPDAWRPHVKTAKLAYIMQQLIACGVKQFKCATTLELAILHDLGARDVLIAFPAVGATARRVRQLAEQHQATRTSALVENIEQVQEWVGSHVGLFIDVNSGMNRTGIEQARVGDIVRLAEAVKTARLPFNGLHYYDGHLGNLTLPEREETAHRGYDRLMDIVAALDASSIRVHEVITAGTPAFPSARSYEPFGSAPFVHRVSPGTIVYGDCTSLSQLPPDYGYRPAAVVVSTVLSHPTRQRFTCDAGHKTVSADSGVPTCAVIGRPDWLPGKPSEEHLPIDAPANASIPAIGSVIYLVPRHVCPTVNNFDHAVLVADKRIRQVERVTARGREAPVVA